MLWLPLIQVRVSLKVSKLSVPSKGHRLSNPNAFPFPPTMLGMGVGAEAAEKPDGRPKLTFGRRFRILAPGKMLGKFRACPFALSGRRLAWKSVSSVGMFCW